jgi:hypothetical protein
VKGFVFPDRSSDDLYFATDTLVWGISDLGTSASQNWAPVTLPGPPGTRPSMVLLVPGQTWLYVGGSDGSLHQLDLTMAPPTLSSVALGQGVAAIGAPTLDIGFTPNLVYVGSEGGVVYGVTVPY